MEQYRAKREIIQDYQQRLMDMERSLSEINEKESNKLQTVQILQAKLQQLQKEISQLDVKSERAKKAITKTSLDFRRKIGVETKELLPEEYDFMIRKAKELGSIVLAEVTKIAEKIPSAHLTVEEIMEKVRFLISNHSLLIYILMIEEWSSISFENRIESQLSC